MSNSTVEFVEVQGIKVETNDEATWIKNDELSEFIIINSNRGGKIKSENYLDESNIDSNYAIESKVKIESPISEHTELPRCSVITGLHTEHLFKLEPTICDLSEKNREHLESYGMVFNEEIIDHTESGHCDYISNVNKTGFDIPEGEYVIEVADPKRLSTAEQQEDTKEVPATTPKVEALTKQTDLTFTRVSCNICHTPYYSQRGLQAHLRYAHRPNIKYIGDYTEHRFKPYTTTPEKYTSASILAPSPSGKLCSIKCKKINKNIDSTASVIITNSESNISTDLIESNTNTTNVIKSTNSYITESTNIGSQSQSKGPYYQCPTCCTRFISEHSLRLHYGKTHDDKSIVIAMPGAPSIEKIVNSKTNVNNSVYFSVPGTKVSQSDDVYFHCTQCTSRFLNENSLKRHFSNIHGHVPFKKK